MIVKEGVVFLFVAVLLAGCYYSIIKKSAYATVFLWSWAALLLLISIFQFHFHADVYIVSLVFLTLLAYLFFVFKASKEKELENAHESTRLVLDSYNDKVDNERRRIASVLHDSVNQNLILSKLYLNNLREQLDDKNKVKAIDEVVALIEDVYQSSRKVIKTTRSEVLESLGLIDAIHELVSTYQSLNNDVEYSFVYDNFDIDTKLSMSVYHIVSEALLNIIKHAQATRVSVELKKKRDKQCQLIVKDNGRGIPEIEAHAAKGIGLIDIRERARRIGGRLTIDSSKVGTTISIQFSLD